LPAWDEASRKQVRDALKALATTVPDTRRMFGAKEQVDPVRHLIGTAMGWGGNNERDAFYLTLYPELNDGTTVHRRGVFDHRRCKRLWLSGDLDPRVTSRPTPDSPQAA
jgi:hypothetical protein